MLSSYLPDKTQTASCTPDFQQSQWILISFGAAQTARPYFSIVAMLKLTYFITIWIQMLFDDNMLNSLKKSPFYITYITCSFLST